MNYFLLIYLYTVWRCGINCARVAELSVIGGDQRDTAPGDTHADPRNLHIRCSAELDPDERLHSLKLYTTKKEIFRYTPNNKPTSRSFEADGTRVVDAACEGLACDVSLHVSVPPASDVLMSLLRLRCEATTAGPHFLTVQRDINVTLKAEGEGSPVLSWSREDMMARCEAAPALPPAQLLWTIDDYPPPASWEQMTGSGAAEWWGGRVSWSTLRAVGTTRLEGTAGRRLRCVAGSRVAELVVPGDALYDHYTAAATATDTSISSGLILTMVTSYIWRTIA